MDRRKRAAKPEADNHASHAACAVCAAKDERLLVTVQLEGGTTATLCGSHALMLTRSDRQCRTISDLRTAFADRRSTDRRGTSGEVDELAERLTAAFTRDRRASERRAGS